MEAPSARRPLIRGLILGSLALLFAGAVAPLLTTERFYFFANTFSLVSALQQLFANGQTLIALVIGFFSLCVPLVKAAVIWIAASEAKGTGPLLRIADRFGKWSMLEVFVAALVIVALKLGPVVDARLHYGAYLLAGSVLLSGIASQLFVHERLAVPLFSSQLTLTIGAIGGAFAATLLIALLNPGMLPLEALVGTPESRCIQRVVQLDQVYAAASRSESDYVSNLGQIELTRCPEAFREAFSDYMGAWRQLAEQPADGDEPGWLERAGQRLGLITTRDDTLEEIAAAWDRVAAVALEHGVMAPGK